jgi:hypothetical protein
MSTINPNLSSQIRKGMRDLRLPCTVEHHLCGRWMSGSPIIRIGLARQLNLLRIQLNYLTLKLPVIGSSTVQCYGF